MKIQKQFIEFLKREGVFEKYVANWKNHERIMGFKTIIKVKRSYIISAFNWGCGSDFAFWRGINIKWQKRLKALEKKNPALYHTRCHDCGQFVPKNRWVRKDDIVKHWALCCECLSGYDEVY